MSHEDDAVGPGRERQRTIFVNGVAGKKSAVPVAPDRLEAAACEAMSAEGFAYVAGGAGMERTMDANRHAFDRWQIVPRVLRDVASRVLSVELFGTKWSMPLVLAPIGVLEMAHPEADRAAAKAAAAEGVPMIFSSQASVPMEACAELKSTVEVHPVLLTGVQQGAGWGLLAQGYSGLGETDSVAGEELHPQASQWES